MAPTHPDRATTGSDPLAALDTWDVDHAAAAVFDRTGIVADHGEVTRPFALASVSKILAAIVVHIAVEEGSITLDDAAGPEGSTVRHLLAHASGLAPDGASTDASVLGPPGHRRIYSNLGFETLAAHVADRTGMGFDAYAELALVEALDLPATTLRGSPAHAYHASVADLVTVLRAMLDGRLLAPSSVAALTTPAFADLAGVLPGYGGQDPNPWGLGVEVRGDKTPHWTAPTNSPATWGHFGRTGTFLWWDSAAGSDGLGLVVLTDRDFDQWAIDAWPPLATAVLARFGSA